MEISTTKSLMTDKQETTLRSPNLTPHMCKRKLRHVKSFSRICDQ